MPTLHITNGGDAGDKLRRVVDGPVTLACDVLHEGPCPPVDGDGWYEARAQFLAGYGTATRDEVEASLAADDQAILDACTGSAKASGGRDALVLWFEHDLFDQLAIIRTLDLVRRALLDPPRDPIRASLICIDRFPGVDRFVGLGQLTPDQLATLIGTARPVTRQQYEVAAAAWSAFRSPDPRDLYEITVRLEAEATDESVAPLPFLRDALLRFFAEYPSTVNGLSRTEQLALEALSSGPMSGGALFTATQALEPRPFLGDLTFYAMLQDLASARVPLVAADGRGGADGVRLDRIAITDAGREVLAGRSDHVALNGIDRWRGGVHLVGTGRSPWRWDTGRETLVS